MITITIICVCIAIVALGIAYLAVLSSRRFPTISAAESKKVEAVEQDSNLWIEAMQKVMAEQEEPLYKDDLDTSLRAIESQIISSASISGLAEKDVTTMLGNLQAALDMLPIRPPALDDLCPECGEAFAMDDDYVCGACRNKM